ncbi:sulfotransferase family protein [Mangrovimicrobium sediminis]|nr:sulfotransferase [Haliea sp. SAOS-164]
MKAPNTFLIGAPKCGTTALSEYLGTHPRVFMCQPKEPHFFGTDMRAYGCCADAGAYGALFDAADAQHEVVMEASVLYLYSDDAVPNILAACPAARFIVMLRHPVDYLHAFHSQLLLNADEWIEDFDSAWRASRDGTRDAEQVRTNCRIPKLLDYPAVGRLGEQVQRLLGQVDRERVHFIFFEDFSADTAGEYRRVLDFLGLENDGRENFDVIHSNKVNRIVWLGKWRKRQQGPLIRAWIKFKLAVGLRHLSLTGWLHRLNRKPQMRNQIDTELRDDLLQFFHDDIHALQAATGRDLRHWLKTAPTTRSD